MSKKSTPMPKSVKQSAASGGMKPFGGKPAGGMKQMKGGGKSGGKKGY
jgi:hypothetical protein